MGTTSSREMVSVHAVNTPMVGVCGFSTLFNSVDRGWFRYGNVYTNFALVMLFGLSTGFTEVIHEPIRGAKFGVAGSLLFLAGRPLKILYTQRFLSPVMHNAIGSLYLGYHGFSWYRATYEFEDAGEDDDLQY